MKVLRRALLYGFAALVLVVLAGGAFLLNRYRTFARMPFGAAGKLVVEIPPKSGPHTVAKLLAESGVVSNAELFTTYVRHFRHAGALLKRGEYEFELPATPDAVIDKLVAGQVVQHKVTIPEGLRLDEIAPLVEAAGLGTASQFLKLTQDPALVKKLGATGASLEGWVFPDTYSFEKGTRLEEFLGWAVARSKSELREAHVGSDSSRALTDYQALTLASIIEKETAAPAERPRVSCVFHNRLAKGIKLQTDPTVIYAKLLREGLGAGPVNITKKDLETPHPYNTYTNKGLPPGPIASPGAASMRAAFAPLKCDDLFFVSRNDGTHVFCPNLACHEANVRKWQIEYFKRKRAAK